MQDNNENEFLDLQEDYALPQKKEVAVDLQKKEMVDLSSLSPIEKIRLTAKESGIELKEFAPKFNRFDKDRQKPYAFDTGCRRPGCYGRGYRGWDGDLPVPCDCLFKPEHRNNNPAPNRKTNRNFSKYAQSQSQFIINQRAKIYGLIHSKGDVWLSKNGVKFDWCNVKGKWDFRRNDRKTNTETVDYLDGEQ